MTPSYDTRVRGGSVYLHGTGLTRVDLLLTGGRVAAIVAPDTPAEVAGTVDASGCWVLPGAIDPHVHLGKDIRVPRDPDDAERETASAVAGGVTTMLVYLMSAEPYGEVFESARKVMEANSHCDFGFHFVLGTPTHLAEFGDYVSDLGVSSFKFFMNFRDDEGAYLGMPGNDDAFMYDILRLSAEHGAMINPHPENIELVRRLRNQPRDESRGPLWAWHCSRPEYVEAEAQQRVAYLASVTGASVYAVHTSSEAALEAAWRVKTSYPHIFVETCAQYLTLSTEDVEVGSYAKVNPPVRPPENSAALWRALAERRIDCVGSDHNARHRTKKETDIWSASAGFPGVGTVFGLTLSEGLRRGVELATLVDVTSTRAARLFGMYPRKGTIAVGSDADLVIVRPDTETIIMAAEQHSAGEYTPWEGRRLDVRIEHTLVRGHHALRDGSLTDELPGSYITRRTSGAAALAPTTTEVTR